MTLQHADLSFNPAHEFVSDRMVRTLPQTVLESVAFKILLAMKLGMHSIRKGPATYCARNDISRDNIESRGRWKGVKKQVDTYIDIKTPVPGIIG
jgi:hypothetical protein